VIVYRRVKALLLADYQRQTAICPGEVLNYNGITLGADGLLTIVSGYAWDFASGAIDNKTIREGSLVHDALCELIHNNLLSYHEWGAAADEMKTICRENGMTRIRAWYICRAIKLAGPGVTVSRLVITE
jgi:hypothetical protein